jgi:uncharacterized protein (UPF0548 family)
MTKATCKATAKNGKRCPMGAGASGFCFTHDPARAAERAAARRKGGMFKRAPITSEPVKVATVADVLELVNRVIADSWGLENSPARARVLLTAAESAVKTLQIGALEERVAALEAKTNDKQS